MTRCLEAHMPEGEAARLEDEVISAALIWTALIRHDRPGAEILAAAQTLYSACRLLHAAREKAFARKMSGEPS